MPRRLLRIAPPRDRVGVGDLTVSENQMALRKELLVLLALGVSVSLLMGCTTRVRQCDPANVPGSNCYTVPGPPYRN